MVKKDFLVSPDLYDISSPIAGIEEIRRCNPPRFEMEQLSAILYADEQAQAAVGCKYLTENEFWVRGHMPGAPLLPGVILCESAAQLASYYVGRFNIMGDEMMGFAGMDEVKFRGIVRPGDTLVVQSKFLKMRRILITAQFMAIVGDNIVAEGIIKGFPLQKKYLQ